MADSDEKPREGVPPTDQPGLEAALQSSRRATMMGSQADLLALMPPSQSGQVSPPESVAPSPAPEPPAAPAEPTSAQDSALSLGQRRQTMLWAPGQQPGLPPRRDGPVAPAPVVRAPEPGVPRKKMSLWVWGAGSMVLWLSVFFMMVTVDPDGPAGQLMGTAVSSAAKQAFKELRPEAAKALEGEEPHAIEEVLKKYDALRKRFAAEPARFAEAVDGVCLALRRQYYSIASGWFEQAKKQAEPGGSLDKAAALFARIEALQPLNRRIEGLQMEAAGIQGEVQDRLQARFPTEARKAVSEGKYAAAAVAYDLWLARDEDPDGLQERTRLRGYLGAETLVAGARPGELFESQLQQALELLEPILTGSPAMANLERLSKDAESLEARIQDKLNPRQLAVGWELIAAGEFEEARQAFTQVVASPPPELSLLQRSVARFGLARSLALLGRYPEAEMELERVNREAPQMSEVYLWKGHCLTMMAVDLSDPQDAQTQGAVAAYKTAVELMPGDARPLGRLAQMCAGLGLAAEAETYRKQAFDAARSLPNQVNLHEAALMAQPRPTDR